MSVFSAPRYCDATENRGAYINIWSDYKLKYEQFDAVPHPDIKPMVRPTTPDASLLSRLTRTRLTPTAPSCPVCERRGRKERKYFWTRCMRLAAPPGQGRGGGGKKYLHSVNACLGVRRVGGAGRAFYIHHTHHLRNLQRILLSSSLPLWAPCET